MLAAGALGCWVVTIAALAGGYRIGDYMISMIGAPGTESHAQNSGETDDRNQIDVIAEDLAKIAPAAGSSE